MSHFRKLTGIPHSIPSTPHERELAGESPSLNLADPHDTRTPNHFTSLREADYEAFISRAAKAKKEKKTSV